MEEDSSCDSSRGEPEASPPVRPLEVFLNSKGKLFLKFTLNGLDWDSYPLGEAIPCEERHNMAFKFGGDVTAVVQSVLFAHGFNQVSSECPLFNVLWTWTHPNLSVVRGLKWFQRINHFLRSEQITHKDYLCMNVQRMQKSKGVRHFSIIPQTFVLPSELSYFKETFRKGSVWIVKPCHSSRGRRIYLINNPSQVCTVEPVVVSKYVDNPLCINGYKFDLRLYVLVTSFDPLRVYMYTEGLGRFAAEPYSKSEENLTNLYMHLTNYSINKTHPDFVMSQSKDVENYGNKWSLSAILTHLKRGGHNIQELMMSIEDAVIKTIISGEVPIAAASRNFQPYKTNCFELFGFDILIDETLKPWVLEVNLSPSLTCDSPLDFKIKSNLITDLLSLVGIPIQDPNPPPPTHKLVRTVKRISSVSTEEQQALSHAVDEYKRRGHFVRIFPSEDSWELYGAFLENRTPYNFSLHTHIYSDNVIKIKWPPHSTTCITTMISRRMKRVTQIMSPDQVDDVKGLSAVQRVKLYVKQLQGKGDSLYHQSLSNDATSTEEEDKAAPATPKNVIMYRSVLSVPSLNHYQARLILAAYLEKVYDKLIYYARIEGMVIRNVETFEKNVNLFEKFISSASQNLLRHLVKAYALPRHSLPLIVRCKMLAQLLMNLIFAYKEETTVLKRELSDNVIGRSFGGRDNEEGDPMLDDTIKYFIATASERQLERVLREISATTDSPLVFKLLEDLKVVHMTRRPEVSCAKPRKVNPKRRSLSAGAPIKEHNPLRERRCQSVIPSATRISQRGLKPDDSNYFLCDKTVSSVLKRGTMTERSCLQRGRRRLSGDFQSLRLPVSSTRTQSNDDLRPQGCIYRQALKAESLARVKL